MTDRIVDDATDSQNHPELLAWLSERAAGFDEWALGTGTPERWDFTPASLDALEGLVKQAVPGEEDIDELRCGAFLQGAVWYLGEVACRSAGVVWRYEPFGYEGSPLPPLFAEEREAGTIDTPCLGPTGDSTQDRLYVMGSIYQLFWSHDEFGDPIEQGLRGVVYDCVRYQQLADWLRARAAGFEEWSRETGQAESWDFSPESVDVLEEVVRGRYGSEEEIKVERDGLFVQGAVWYLGEVIRRSTQETSWGYDPFLVEADDIPFPLFASGADDELDTPYLTQWHFQEEDLVYPLTHFTLLFWKDSAKYGHDPARLRDAFDDFE
ncbi:hypothetical protein [Streptomyces sp. NPDC101393]|uniref:hypothetical protein n=1 Tax=Streptomyces sp. NPDC101393 TaxID=3366141 RepID=UPI003808EF15